jgi:hypothetical protein
MQAILNQNFIAEKVINTADGNFGEKIGVISSLLGCWHKNLTRPFTNANQSYRACLHCGARRKFDADKFKTFGAFYYPPTISQGYDKR